MTSKNRNKKVLVIQARLNPKIIFSEQANFKKIIKNTGFDLTFINPLLDNEKNDWNDPCKLLDQYGCSIWLGSAEIDLSQQSKERERYLSRVSPLIKIILKEEKPALGICLGHQTFALVGGAKIERDIKKREFGTTILKLTESGKNDTIFDSLPDPLSMVFVHNDSVINLPSGFITLGYTMRNQFSALRKGRIVTLQGHPEIINTTALKKRIIQAQMKNHLKIYNFTYPLVDPDQTHIIIKNFLAGIFQ